MERVNGVGYGLRFININESTLFSIKSVLDLKPSSIKKYYKNTENYVLTYPILESLNFDVMKKIISEADAEKIDIFMSLRPESDSDIIDVPDYVTRLLVVPRLKLTLSYTITFDSE